MASSSASSQRRATDHSGWSAGVQAARPEAGSGLGDGLGDGLPEGLGCADGADAPLGLGVGPFMHPPTSAVTTRKPTNGLRPITSHLFPP